MSLRVLLCGAKGRMGRAIIGAADAADAVIAHAIDEGDDPAAVMADCDVVIDFSYHLATSPLVALAAAAGKPVVIGTTGHSDEARQQILSDSKRIPLVWAGNYSVGVNLLFYLTQQAARVLGDDYQAEVLEMHHCHKKDAPSGTALDLVDSIKSAADFGNSPVIFGREGQTGERDNKEIGVHAIRGGEIIGEHTVYFMSANDRIELTHRASDRGIFARGALRAASWVVGKPAGLYNMRDVLGLK